jgi:hypothetical protein
MTPPDPKPSPKPAGVPAAESGPELRRDEPGIGEAIDVDVEKHLRWLETGEGEPWPPASQS